jgi:chorismate mutase
MNLNELKNDWVKEFSNPMIIAGPCSAESEAQMLETARRLKETNAEISAFRAGIWKPRTKPNGFEGVGVIGLNWLKKLRKNSDSKQQQKLLMRIMFLQHWKPM